METKELIEAGIRRFMDEVPSLKKLKLIFRLDLKAKGDTQTWRVELPAIELSKDIPKDAQIEVEILRAIFNELVEDGKLQDFKEAYEHGQIKASGNEQLIKLVGVLAEKQEQRTKLKKARR